MGLDWFNHILIAVQVRAVFTEFITFPMLYKLAMKYLCIQATSVPSERVFSSLSTAGDIVTAERARIDSELVDSMIFLKKNVDLLSID